MTFGQVPAAAAVFLDANTLVYHFINHMNRSKNVLIGRLRRSGFPRLW